MNIAYLIPTRGAPQRCLAAIEVARNLASGNHNVTYYVGVDNDDDESIKFFQKLNRQSDLVVEGDDRPIGLGSVWNRLAALAGDAECFCIMPDDAFVVTPHWDEIIAGIMSQAAITCVAWNDLGSPNQPTYPIISRGWYNLAGVYTEHFPFWFDDTWLAEVWSFFTGASMVIVPDLVLTSKKGKTKRMMDLAFWWNFFSTKRPERIAKAAEIRETLGVAPIDPALIELIRLRWDLRDRESMLRIDEIEANLREPGGLISNEYLIAKNRAKAILDGPIEEAAA